MADGIYCLRRQANRDGRAIRSAELALGGGPGRNWMAALMEDGEADDEE